MNGSVFLVWMLLNLISIVSSNVLNSGNYSIARFVRQANCDGFKCNSGECINRDLQCDGIANCKDASDETDACKSINCPSFLYECKYGACIDSTKECNGQKDCHDNSDETHCTNTNLNKVCKKDEFGCKSGECIPSDKLCNGKADCSDKSDETKDCSNLSCPGFLYRCRYGACVDGNAKCNGVKDCLDNSDEDPKKCGGTPTVSPPTPSPPPPITTESPLDSSASCILPNHPVNGKWSLASDPSATLAPGQRVPSSTFITYTCNKQYKLSYPKYSHRACLTNSWAPIEDPSCILLCPPIQSTATTKMICRLDGQEISCNEPVHGTVLTATCADYHEVISNVRLPTVCSDGNWNLQPPQCVPACGKRIVKASELAVNAEETFPGEFPWTVAVYRKFSGTFSHICGGSILTKRLIISAAHCFFDKAKIDLMSPSEFKFVVGKYYRDFYDARDSMAQVLDANSIIAKNYRGALHGHNNDFALILTKEEIKWAIHVAPICFSEDINNRLYSKQIGIVTGWGYTKAGADPSTELLVIKLPYETESDCKAYFQEDDQWWKKFYTEDKLCAGYFNKNKGVCKGDSGGGYAFDHHGRYYIHGVVSVSPKGENAGECNVNTFSLFTDVQKHYNYISQYFAN